MRHNVSENARSPADRRPKSTRKGSERRGNQSVRARGSSAKGAVALDSMRIALSALGVGDRMWGCQLRADRFAVIAETPEEFDLIVVGAGPAGSAAGLGALRMDPSARVLILDRAPLGRDKVCGDAVGPDAIVELTNLGLTDILRPEERVSRFRLVAASGANILGIAPLPGYVVPRREFDHRLMMATIAAGAIFHQHTVHEIHQDEGGVVVDGRYSAPVLIGADGANSMVRRVAGRPAQSRSTPGSRRQGIRSRTRGA